jgi:hypothetical protein
MDITSIFVVEIAGSILAFALAGRWYVWPRLAQLSLADALIPLLLLHVTRTLGLTMLVPNIVDPQLPREIAIPAAYGDLVAAGLALASVVALRAGLAIAPALAWTFSLEGVGDLLNAFVQGIRVDVPQYELGPAWFIFTVLVPALLVTHVMILARLVDHAREGGGLLLKRLALSRS